MEESKEICPTCRKHSTESPFSKWLQCNACRGWYHTTCLSLEKIELINIFHCPKCEPTHGPSVPYPTPRKSERSQIRLNYADMNEGTSPGDQRYWEKLLQTKNFKEDNFKRYVAKQVNLDFLRKEGIKAPFVIENNDPELEMHMPANDITVYAIAELVGKETPVDIIDVATQSELTGWTMSKWADYFHSEDRDRIRNVISLEISHTKLGDQIQRPKIVRDIDWIDQMWPDEEEEYPKVQLYCLMGTKDSYTDFHIDFGGSSVFYHILRGSKRFYFIEPTDTNLKKYQKWSSSSDQSVTFLGDLVKDCYCVELKAGNTMIIPTGWIHSVFTPEDAIVIGGNFLHTFNIGTQLKVHRIEEATEVPMKFRFPFYKKINWYALNKYSHLLFTPEARLYSMAELESIVALAKFLQKEIASMDSPESKTSRKILQIPDSITDPSHLAQAVQRQAEKMLNQKRSPTNISQVALVEKEEVEVKPKLKLKLVCKPRQEPVPTIPQQDDYDYEEEEEEEEEDDDILEVEEDDDEEYKEDPYAPIELNNIAISRNDHILQTDKKRRKRKTPTKSIKYAGDSSSDDEDSMGTRKTKSFSKRKRSLSNNSSSLQPTTTAKQRILGMINIKKY